jgi:hypothetical protein
MIRERGERDFLLQEALDVAQTGRAPTPSQKEMAMPLAPARAGAADAVHVRLGLHGQIEVEDVGHVIDVKAAGGDIGGDQDAHAAGAEGIERAGALVLGLVAVDRDRIDAVAMQASADAIGAVLGLGEDHRAVDAGLAKEVLEQRLLAAHGTMIERLLDLGRGRRGGRATDTRTGSRSSDSARCMISLGIVALKSSVWRGPLGSAAAMVRMGWMKPMSSMRSASSRTKTLTAERST